MGRCVLRGCACRGVPPRCFDADPFAALVEGPVFNHKHSHKKLRGVGRIPWYNALVAPGRGRRALRTIPRCGLTSHNDYRAPAAR